VLVLVRVAFGLGIGETDEDREARIDMSAEPADAREQVVDKPLEQGEERLHVCIGRKLGDSRGPSSRLALDEQLERMAELPALEEGSRVLSFLR
jgi:hypothetical protein